MHQTAKIEITPEQLADNLAKLKESIQNEALSIIGSRDPNLDYDSVVRKARLLYIILDPILFAQDYTHQQILRLVSLIQPYDADSMRYIKFDNSSTISISNLASFLKIRLRNVQYIEDAQPIYENYRRLALELLHNLYGVDDANSEKYLALMGKTNFLALLPSGIREFAMKNGMSLSNKPASIIMPDEFTVEEYIQKQLAMQTGKEKIPYELTALIRVFVSYFYTPKISNNPFADKSEFDQVLLTLSKSTEIASLVGIIKSHGQIWQNDDFNVETFAERMIDAITKLAYYNAIRDHNYTNYADALLELIRFCIPNGEIEKITAIKESFDKRVQEEMEKDTVTSSIKQQLTSIKNYFDINFYSTLNQSEQVQILYSKSEVDINVLLQAIRAAVSELKSLISKDTQFVYSTLMTLKDILANLSKSEGIFFADTFNFQQTFGNHFGSPSPDIHNIQTSLQYYENLIDQIVKENDASRIFDGITNMLQLIIIANINLGNEVNLNNQLIYKSYEIFTTLVKILYKDGAVQREKIREINLIINTYRPES